MNRVAKWDGDSWLPLGSGLDDVVTVLVVFDDDGPGPNPPALYVGGTFTVAGGAPADHIAKWDGSSWSAVGTGTDAGVGALAVYDEDGPGPQLPALFCAGSFTTAGGITVNRIARWDGSTWSALEEGIGATGPSHGVHTLAVFDADAAGPGLPALFVGGSFPSVNGQAIANLARWNGTSWSAVGFGPGAGVTGTVGALTVHDEDGDGPSPPRLCVGGYFESTGGIEVNSIAYWNGVFWSALGPGVGGGFPIVNALASFDQDGPGPLPPILYAAGGFDYAGDLYAEHIARWNGVDWLPVGTGMNGAIADFTVYDDDADGPNPPLLYAGGGFDAAGNAVTEGIASYDGSDWAPVGGGADGSVNTLLVFDEDGEGGELPVLVVGGGFIGGGNPLMRKIATWDGEAWSPLGSGMTGGTSVSAVRALAVWDPDDAGPAPPSLYAGGEFTHADGVLVNRIARWTGSSWESLAGGMNDTVLSLGVYDPDGPGPAPSCLYAGGEFTQAGGVSASRIAQWDGSSWSQLGDGVTISFGRVYALAAFDDDGAGPSLPLLYVGGHFSFTGGDPAANIARWDGASWAPVGSGMNHWVFELFPFDLDGAGPAPTALYAGGLFTSAGGSKANRVAKWDGTSWTALGSGLNEGVGALVNYPAGDLASAREALYVGGSFTTADGTSSSRIAYWSLPVLAADLTGDGVVNVLDLIELVMSFGPCEDCAADINDDGIVNVLDLIALIMNFGPCPGTQCVWDVNGDGIVDQSDVAAVTNNMGPCEDPDNCPWDVNGDGVVNGQDVAAVAMHLGPCP